VLLGLPISERAYGTESLAANFTIIAVHSPLCYFIGITSMELMRNRGSSGLRMARLVIRAMFSNALILGIALGFVVNLSGLTPPEVLSEAINLMARAALPAAIFGLGGVLARYRPEGDIPTVLMIMAVGLVIHPMITLGLGTVLEVPHDALRNGVITAAMAPGVNAYIFADMYGRAKRVNATAVLLSTVASVLTVWVWLQILG
jgi:predicted permease